jgi:hypothetical protein
MKKVTFVALVLSALLASSWAQSKQSAVGTWKLDASGSDFGAEPAPKSVTIVVLKESPQMLSWRVRVVDNKGKVIAYSWSGPEDGSMHPVMQNGKEIGKQSAKREDDGSILRHGEEPDGSSFDARSKISDDGKTMKEEATAKDKDGKETKEKTVYRRSAGEMATKKKSDA